MDRGGPSDNGRLLITGEETSLCINNTEYQDAGTYQQLVTHFALRGMLEEETEDLFLLFSSTYCSEIILDAMRLLATFKPIMFQVHSGRVVEP